MATVVELITQEAQRQGVDPNVAIEVANAESGLDPFTADSSAGAIGLFQLEPATAAALGVNPRDVNQNIQGGIAYLRQMLARFSSIPAALAAYNWGPGNLSKAIAQWGANWSAHLPPETSSYVSKILANLGKYQATVTPTSVANGLLQMLTPTTPPAPDQLPTDGTAPPPPADHSMDTVLILTAIAVGVYIVAEVLSD